ncbi:TetR/AcrR family transcriptional regulator [Nocardiopsis protaetiae]|uniref:TetR/AcrR family transcriptional regulator n=1 Tax=Nocardiopsis protaetiae TaxID=3382270 RepID=UPI00387A8A90
MPRSPEQNEAMRAATRERIRAAAMRLFAHQGYAAVNMRRIAAEAGMSTGLVYRHFATKEELYGDLVGEAAAGLALTVARFRAPESHDSPAELLRAFCEGFLRDVAGDQGFVDFFLLMNQAFAHGVAGGDGPEEVPPAVRDLIGGHRALIRATVELIERGQALGGFRRGPADELATCLFAALGGLVTMRSVLGEGFAVPSAAVLLAPLIEEDTDDG